MNQAELNEHRNYLADTRKVEAYRAALAEVLEPGDTVLDLGAGTGLLGLLACQQGAGSVIAVEQDRRIIEIAKHIAAASTFADRINHIRAFSSEISLDVAVDVAICDQIGGLVHDAGVLSHFADVRRRLLAPQGRLIPAAFRIFLAPVSFTTGRNAIDFWRSAPAGLDVTAVHQIAANTEWRYNAPADELIRLGSGEEIGSFLSDDARPFAGSCSFEIDRAGQLDGYVGWFEAKLSPSVTLTNDPWAPDRFRRWWNFYPVTESTEVAPGQRVDVRLNLSPSHQLVAWRTSIDRGGHGVIRFDQSTFLSAPVHDVTSMGRPLPLNQRVAQLRSVLDQVDGRRTPKDIAEALGDEVGTIFTTAPQLASLIASVARTLG